jgi:hypothetical protein
MYVSNLVKISCLTCVYADERYDLASALDSLWELLITLTRELSVPATVTSMMGVASGVTGTPQAASLTAWDTVAILDVLALHGVDDALCEVVGEAAIDAHGDSVQLHVLGGLLLGAGLHPVLAMRVAHTLAQVSDGWP